MCLGIPGQIVRLDDEATALATVEIGGVRRQVSLLCVVDDEHPFGSLLGDWVVVHVGFAMSRVDAAEAERTLQLLGELAALEAGDSDP